MPALPPPRAASGRVLVIEDDPMIADAVASRLRSEGFSVQVAHDGTTTATVAVAARSLPVPVSR